jgi:hypothetical protein
MESIHLALAIAPGKGREVYQIDVKNVFLLEDISEDIYMDQQIGFIYDLSLVCGLKKYLYGIKKAPIVWYAKMDSYLLSHNFVRWKSDPNFYMFGTTDLILILVL